MYNVLSLLLLHIILYNNARMHLRDKTEIPR